MNITRFVVNMLEENCYLLYDETKEAAIIDCGAFYPEERAKIDEYITRNGLTLTHLLNTHGHFDHIFGASHLYTRYGVKMEICDAERETYTQSVEQMKRFIGCEFPLETIPVGQYFKHVDELRVGNMLLKVIATPGHTPGGVCFYCEKERVLFSGDSLFRHGIGRCDLPGGSETSLVDALKSRILTLPDDVKVLPGHGEASTVGEEKQSNPYLR